MGKPGLTYKAIVDIGATPSDCWEWQGNVSKRTGYGKKTVFGKTVLAQRQNDGLLPAFPIWDDVRTFDGRPWRGIVDVVSGGFPCQDISAANSKGAGIDGERSGLWREMARIIGEVRPRFALVENSPMLTVRGLGRVLGDLAEMGFDAQWGVLGAAHVGAPHLRERIWIVAHAIGERSAVGVENEAWRALRDKDGNGAQAERGRDELELGTARRDTHVADPNSGDEHGRRGTVQVGRHWSESAVANDGDAARTEWRTEPSVGRVADGVAARVDRLKAIGNGQVPQCAAQAWRILTHNAAS